MSQVQILAVFRRATLDLLDGIVKVGGTAEGLQAGMPWPHGSLQNERKTIASVWAASTKVMVSGGGGEKRIE